MKLLFEADNAIEARLIADLLERENIFVRIDGELLQGAIGELQAMGLVRVLVFEADLQRAQKILDDEWHE